jgi:SAM-dependent methyltransferase
MEPLTPATYWDREVTAPVTPPSRSWMANLDVRHYINTCVSGEFGVWPTEWFKRTYPTPFKHALSIGCGTGALERDFLRLNVAEQIDAFDASEQSLNIARQEASAAGVAERVHYSVADFNSVKLPRGKYDLICFHQSLHHVAALEHLMKEVAHALTDDGVLYLDEFIGPSRNDWNEYQIRWYRALYEYFPREVRFFDTFQMPIQEEDPSEAIRSSEIVSRLAIGFTIEHFRGYGGNVLAMMFPDLVVENLSDDQVRMMIRSEQALIAAGDTHFHAVIVAKRKRSRAQRVIADLRYSIEARYPQMTTKLRAFIRFLRAG